MKTNLRITILFFFLLTALTQKSFGQCTTAKYASIPYTQDFEKWITLCDNIDSLNVPDSSWINIPASGDSSWRRDDQGPAGSWVAYYDGAYSPAAYSGSYSARFHTIKTGSIGRLNLYIDCSTVGGTKLLSFYHIDPNSNSGLPDSMNVYISTDGGTTFGPSIITCVNNSYTANWTHYIVPITSNSPTTVISFVATAGFDDSYDMGLDYVQVFPPCQGKPSAGNLIARAACLGDTLMLSGSSWQDGSLSFTWEQSSDSINWSAIAGTDTSFIVVAPFAQTYYRAIVTCNGSGLSDTAAIKISGNVSFYRNIPYTEDFENEWVDRCAVYDVPDSGWINTPPTGNYSWRRDDEGASANWTNPTYGLWYSPYNDEAAGNIYPEAYSGNHCATFDAYDADNDFYDGQFGATDALNLYVNCSTVKGTKQLSFYYININNPSYPDSMNVYVSTNGGITFGPSIITCFPNEGWTHYTAPIASDSAGTVIRFVAISRGAYTDMGLDLVQVLPPCDSKPVAGTIAAPQKECPGDSVPFYLSEYYYSQPGGISFAWQQSSDSINWSTITGDTGTAITVAPVTSTYYRSIVTCNNSGLTDTTAKVFVEGFNGLALSFYRNLPYTEDFESWMNRCDTLDVPDTGWINSPVSGDDSWRRDDQGATANWYYNSGVYVPAAYSGNHSARFHSDGDAPRGSTGTLDLFVNCSAIKGTKELSFYFNDQWKDSMDVYISTNGGSTFSPLLHCTTNTGWTSYVINFASDSPKTVIRFVATAVAFRYDIGLDLVQVLPPCQGKPVAGNIHDTTVCAVNGDLLSLIGTSQANGLLYIWQQSGNGTNWSAIAGDTTNTMVATPFTSTYYRAIVICNGSGLSDTTSGIKLTGTGAFYRSIPYTQDFESWMNRCDTLDVPDTGWINTPATGLASWRRDDQGGLANWDNYPANYYPLSYHGAYSAAFDANDAPYNGSTTYGTLDLYVNCSLFKGTKQLSFYYINPDNDYEGDSMNVYISTDGGNTFSQPIATCPDNILNWTKYIVPIASDSAETVIRFVAFSDVNGSSDIGLDYLQLLPPCQDEQPVAGNIVIQKPCSINGDSLSLMGSTLAYGLSYTWQQSVDNVNWSAIAEDTTTAIYAVPYTSSYYRAIVTCINSALSDTTSPVKVNGVGAFFRSIPYTEDFEQWMNRCDTLDVPDTGWINIPATGNDSWRRDDQGTLANWTTVFDSSFLYYPISFSGNYSAMFNGDAPNDYFGKGTTGTLNLYVNCSTLKGKKALSFYYINYSSGGAQLNVYVSNDGGVTFGPSLVTCEINYNWTRYLVPITSDSSETVISFVATADDGSYPMGLDLVQVLPPCNGKPVAGTASATPALLCSNSSTSTLTLPALAGIGLMTGLTYQWQSSPNNINWANVSGGIGADSDIYVTDTIKATTFYRCIVTCSYSGEADTSQKTEVIYTPKCYCSPQTTAEDGDNIGNVTIRYGSSVLLNNGIDTPAIQPNLLTTGTPYVNWVDSLNGTVINLQQGLTYSVSTTLITDTAGANYPDTAYMFIDYNRDGEWESTERAWSAPYNLPTSNTPVPTTGTFTVPLTADTGLTEMRIQLSDLPFGVDTPCYNFGGLQGETEDYLVYIASGTSGINGVRLGNGSIEIYPDPFNNQVTLYFTSMPAGNFNVVITNTLGQQLMAYSDYTDGNGYKRTIDLHTLPAGVYFIAVIINGNNYVTKMVKTD